MPPGSASARQYVPRFQQTNRKISLFIGRNLFTNHSSHSIMASSDWLIEEIGKYLKRFSASPNHNSSPATFIRLISSLRSNMAPASKLTILLLLFGALIIASMDARPLEDQQTSREKRAHQADTNSPLDKMTDDLQDIQKRLKTPRGGYAG